MKLSPGILILALGMLISAQAQSPPRYELQRTVTLGGEGGWDYLTYDPAGKRLFVTHGTHVVVIDPASGKELADIPDTPGVHGVALAPDFAKGFISAGRSNKVVIFDLKSLKATGTADVGTTPDAITYEPKSHRIFTWNAKSEDATAIDAKTDKVLGSVPVKGKPEFAVADGKGHLFVNIETTNEVAEIDAQKLTVMRRWSLAGCEEPTGLAIDLAHQVLFSGCSNKVLVVSDAKTGAKIAALPIGDHVDGVAFDPGNGLAFSSNGDGTLTVIGKTAGKYGVLQNLETQRGARTLTLNPDTNQIYLVTANFEDAASAPPGSRPKPIPGTFRLLIAGPHK